MCETPGGNKVNHYSVWSMENVVNDFLRSIKREQIRLRTVIYFMLGLTIAWFLNTIGPDSPINM